MQAPTMKAIGILSALPSTDTAAFVERQIPIPELGPDDLLVKIQAISVNPADYRQRQRKLDDGQFSILGWDAAGIVANIGSNVSSFNIGDAVYYAGDLNRPGTNSEFHLVEAALVGNAPLTIDVAQAAALPLTSLTAWEALFDCLGLSLQKSAENKTLLIIGAAGGVGSIALQLARQVPQLTIIATASRPESRTWCENLGAHVVIDHNTDMGQQLQQLNLAAPDFILLLNAPDQHFPILADLIAAQGKICSIVPFTTPPDLNLIMRKGISFHWEFMFTRSMHKTKDRYQQGIILNHIANMIDSGVIASTATQLFGPISANNLGLAHRQLESGRTIGKLVLSGF